MKHFLTFIFSVLLTSAFVSCEDDGGTPEPVDPPTTLLINKNWRATADVTVTTTTAGVSTTTDNYATLQACGKDDFIRFDDDGVLTIDEGPSKCQSNDQQSAKGRWSWNDDRSVITFTEPCLCPNFPATLSGPADLTTATMTVRQTSTATNGSTVVRTVTYGSF